MQKLFIIIILLLSGFLVYADIVADNDQLVESIATPILDELLTGFNENDYAKYSKHEILHNKCIVYILKIGHRRDVYDKQFLL